MDARIQSPDEITVMFNKLQGAKRDWIRTKKKVLPNVMRSPRVFKDVLISKYFGDYTPLEGFAPLYTVNKKNPQSSSSFRTTLIMFAINLAF